MTTSEGASSRCSIRRRTRSAPATTRSSRRSRSAPAGSFGKGWLQGTQAHLEFIPERHTDFIFAVYSEEFGLLGNCLLLVLYMLLIARGLVITAQAASLFSRLLAGP
jgi:cell division protein FtsW (lipid II flippase)